MSDEKVLKKEVDSLKKKLEEAEKLIGIISKGKYQWQETFDAIYDPVMIVTENFEIARANLGLAKSSGKDVRKIIGKKCFKIFAGRKEECVNCPLKKTLAESKASGGRLGHPIHERDYIANAFPFKNEDGSETSVVVHYRDITEEKRLQQELVQQEKMAAIGMLAGGVAHEINNPLGGIIAFAQLIKRDLKDEDPLVSDIEEIENAGQRCKKIVQDLLDFSRISSGREKHWIDINPLLEKVIPFIKMELKSLNIGLKTKFEEDLPSVFGDANRLEQVFLNLLTNACHSMKQGGVLDISTGINDSRSHIEIKISDTGCGIEEKHLKKIFDPFFTTKSPGEGTGLGLSVSYKIVRDHLGDVKVESKIGKGTKFTVLLPTSQEGE